MSGDIFVIEDDEDICCSYDRAFGKFFKLTFYLSGEACLQAIADGCAHPDALLVDYMLPKMTGIEFLQRVRAMKVLAPAIIITGGLSEEMTLASISLDVQAILTKPCRYEEVTHKLKYLVVESRTRKISGHLFNELELFLEYAENLDRAHRQYSENLENMIGKKSLPLRALIKEKEIEKWRKELARARNLTDNLKNQYLRLQKLADQD
tara:strand:+ start:2497 stop:3120 length:624 start_codon:yes stop_codon:yes gene_type:complete